MRTSDTTTAPCCGVTAMLRTAPEQWARRAITESRRTCCARENRRLAAAMRAGTRVGSVEARGREVGRPTMTLRRTLRPVMTAVALVAAVAGVPASARSAPSNIGAASVYGLDHNFTLVGHTDLAKRGMNSPIAVAGRCVYVGNRYYSASPDEKVRPNGGIASIDVKNARRPRQVGTIPPIGLSTQREMRADPGLGILV